jgi:two-component system sensor kinase FixL
MKILSQFSGPESHQKLWVYPLGIALVLLTLWARVDSGLPFDGPVMIVFTVPIIMAAYWGGLWPGLLATLVAMFGAAYYVLPPLHDFAIVSNTERLQETILATVGVLISVICERLRRATRRTDAERARAERGQLASARLAAIVESSMDAVIGKDLNGIITSWNQSACNIFGYEAEEAIGRPISLLIAPDRLTEEDQIIAQIKAGRHVDHYETVRLHKSGAEVLVSLSVSPIHDGAGHIVGASKIARDITEKRRSEAHLQVLQTELAHVARLSAMGQMSAAIAHELNQPLTAIVNYVSAAQRMLASKDPSPQKRAGALEAMEKAAAQTLRAGAIIQNLRQFVEKREAERSYEDLNTVVEEAIALGFVGGADSNVEVVRELATTPLSVQINRIQLQQVLINLIRNGIEAMNQSSRRLITLTTGQESNFAFVMIRDTGPGLPPEVLAKLFQPFVTTKERGMGIGLNICQSIMEAHGGTIEAAVGDGGGAVFRIRLPLDTPVLLVSCP